MIVVAIRRISQIRVPIPFMTKERFVEYLPAWILLSIVLWILFPVLVSGLVRAVGTAVDIIPRWIHGLQISDSALAPLFTEEVDYWSDDIMRWSDEYNLDPNLLATVMQIESCGHPNVSSHAGAQGLFQVMPFHFEAGENYLEPDTNAKRGANFLQYCSASANGDVGLTLACYNGGPSIFNKAWSSWASETQRYYNWGTGIHNDAVQNLPSSETLTQWLNAGGQGLCNMASQELKLG